MSGPEQLLVSGGGAAGAGAGSMEAWTQWSEGWLGTPSRSTLSQVEMALLIIRVGPVIGLLLSFSLGWLRSAFILVITWLWVPITYTGRPLAHLGSVCQSVWSGDMGKCAYILGYVYFLMICLWWLAPHSTSANVGLISIGAIPCFSSSFCKRLKAFGATSLKTSKLTLAMLKSVFTPVRRVSTKHKQFNDKNISSENVSQFIEDIPCGDASLSNHDGLSSRRQNAFQEKDSIYNAKNFSKQLPQEEKEEEEEEIEEGRGVLYEVYQFFVWLLYIALGVSDWTPRLEAHGDEASNMYYGMEGRHVTVLRKNNTKVALLTMLPWKPFSRLWGFVHNLYLPPFLRYVGLPFYSWLFSINLEEAELPSYGSYKNLATFFRRKLRPGVRPIDTQNILTSPADGRVLHLGPVEDGILEQVKGVSYSMRGFFGPPRGLHTGSPKLESAETIDDIRDEDYLESLVSQPDNVMWQCIIYLAPGDYHHIHSPTDWTVHARRHIPGELFSVKPGLARWLQGLFSFNERAIFTGRWQHGFFSMTAVGATNVGSIDIDFDEELKTNVTTKYERNSYFDKSFISTNQSKQNSEEGVDFNRGDHFGEFNLGSTLVLLFEAPVNFQFKVEPGQALRYGEAIGNSAQENIPKSQ